MDAEFVICKECIYWEDCSNKENHDGCYFGEKIAEEEYLRRLNTDVI